MTETTPLLDPPRQTSTPGGSPTGSRQSRELLTRLIGYVPPLVLVGLILFFGLQSSSFWSPSSILTMGSQAGILLTISLGLTLVVLNGSIDLSIGSVALLSGAAVALVAKEGTTGVLPLVAIAVGVGLVAGALNGVVVVYGRVPSLVVTLGTLSLFAGLAETLLRGSAVSFSSPELLTLVNTPVLPFLSSTMLIGLIVFAVTWVLARRTRFGVYSYAIGSNEKVALLSGINTRLVKVSVFVVASLAAGLAGLLTVSQLQSASPALGSSLLLDSIAAIAIGGTSLAGGSGGVERTLVGVLILTVLSSGLNHLGVQDFTQTMIKGAVVVVAATLTLAGRQGQVVK